MSEPFDWPDDDMDVSPSDFLVWCREQGHDTDVPMTVLEAQLWDDYVQDRREVRSREDRREIPAELRY